MNNSIELSQKIYNIEKDLIKKGVSKILTTAYEDKTHYLLFDKFKAMGIFRLSFAIY